MKTKLLCNLQGLQKNSLSNRKIRIHPQPLEDELISSWFCRTAIGNLTVPITFLNLYLGDYKTVFFSDFDWNREDFIKAISQKVGFSKEKVFSITLRSYEGYLFEAQNKFSSNKPFINPVGFRGGRNRRCGLRFCPYCLRESEHFRKKWRLTFSTACVKHRVFLIDRCPECGEPLTIQKWRNDKLNFHCWKCGFEFKKAETERVPEESKGIETIKRLYEILEKGYFEFEGRVYYSIAYFKVLGHFTKVVYNWQRRKWDLLKREEKIVDINLSMKSRGVIYYNIPLKEQYVLFTALVDILSSRERLEKFITDNRLQKTELTRDFEDYPFWYSGFVSKYSGETYSPSLEEVKCAIKYLQQKGVEVNWKNLRTTVGKFVDKRKRKDVWSFLESLLRGEQ